MLKKSTSFLITKGAEVKNPSFQMAFKAIEVKEDGSIVIKGFASTPDIDRYDDIVNPTAFKNAMEGYMKNPVVLLGHDSSKVLGQVTEYKLDKKGLEVTARLTNDIDNTFKNIADKNLRGFSIGFICKAWGYKTEGEKTIREITELDLIETSVVSTPANASALFTLSKSIRLFMDQEEKKSADAEEGQEETTTTDTTTETKTDEAKIEETTTTTTEGDDTTTTPNTTEGEDKAGEDTATVTDGTTSEAEKTDDVKGDVKTEE